MEQANRVESLYQQVADIRDRPGLSEIDTRRVSMNNIAMAVNAATAILRLLAWAKDGGEGLLIRALGLAKPEYINMVAEDLLRTSRLFLLVESQFQIEAAFHNILTALGKPPSKLGFYNIANDILDITGLQDVQAKLCVLNVPALMRNSMHANGIHYGRKSSDTIELVKGVEFRFENQKRVQCGSLFHIVTALSASFEIVDQIFSSGPVVALEQIPDIYATQAFCH